MSKRVTEWKETFREGMFASPELLEKKVHRDLLGYIVHRANRKNRLCWSSQAELARVQNCSTRNTQDLLDYLEEIGALFKVRFSELPKRDQMMIKTLTPDKVTRNSKAYYVCEEWAKDQLETASNLIIQETGNIGISPADQQRGREKANDRRRRYVPASLHAETAIETNPVHDDWQFINAVGVNTGSPTSHLNRVDTGSPTTDRTNEYNPAEISSVNSGQTVGAFDTPSSQEIESQGDSSSLSLPPMLREPSADGDSEAVAPVARAAPLPGAWGQGPRSLPTELGVAGARANERRAL